MIVPSGVPCKRTDNDFRPSYWSVVVGHFVFSMYMSNVLTENLYRVSDFPLAVSLAVWLPVEGIDKGDTQRAYFLFQRSDELNKLVDTYRKRQLRIEPQEFFLRSKELKALLYAE